METVVVKESWKAPFKGVSAKVMRIFLNKFLLVFCAIVTVIMTLLSLGEGNWKMTLVFFIATPLVFYLTMFMTFLLMSPLLLLFKIRTIISPRTYTFSFDHGLLSVLKNDKTMVEVPLEDFNCYSMSSPFGNYLSELMMFYAENGRSKTLTIKTLDLFDEDKLRVRDFFENLTKQKAELVKQKTEDVGEETLSPLEETSI